MRTFMYTYKVWDKKDFNGIDAKKLISTHGLDNKSEAYIIYKNDRAMIFQTHNPFESGFVKMNKDNVHIVAKEHLEQFKMGENEPVTGESELVSSENPLLEKIAADSEQALLNSEITMTALAEFIAHSMES